MILKTFVYSPFYHLRWLLAREYFMEFSRREICELCQLHLLFYLFFHSFTVHVNFSVSFNNFLEQSSCAFSWVNKRSDIVNLL